MPIDLNNLFAIVRLTPGQRVSIYNQMLPVAQDYGLDTLAAHIVEARAHDRNLAVLEQRWSGRKRRIYADEVPALRRHIARVLASMHRVAVAQLHGLPAESPMVQAGERFLSTLFPDGVGPITSLHFLELVVSVEGILDSLSKELAEDVAMLGIREHSVVLAELNGKFRDALLKGRDTPSFAEVEEARELGHTYFLEIVAQVTGTFYNSRNPEHMEKRTTLLAPVEAQVDVTRTKARARRRGRRRGRTPVALPAPSDPGPEDPESS